MKPADMHQLLDDAIRLRPGASAQDVFLHAAMVAELAGKYTDKTSPPPEKARTRRSRTHLMARGFSYPTMMAAVLDLVGVKGLSDNQAAAQLGIDLKAVGKARVDAKARGLWPAKNGVHA